MPTPHTLDAALDRAARKMLTVHALTGSSQAERIVPTALLAITDILSTIADELIAHNAREQVKR